MGKLEDILEYSESNCDKQMFHMCKVRTKELRNCAMSKCCGYCNKVMECNGVCKILVDKFNYLINTYNG
jgi:hypothetical protein